MDKFEQLKQDGIAHGMCEKFQKEWDNPCLAELCSFFFRGMDFCIEHNWPDMELAKQVFDAAELAEYGIFIKSGTARNKMNVCTLDEATVHVYVPDLGTCDIYARHNSKVHIHLGYKAYCYVSVLDNAEVFVEEKEELAKIKASRFSGLIHEPHMFDTIHDKTKEE